MPVLEEDDDDLVPPEDLRGSGRPLLPEDPAFVFSFEAPAFGDWDASGEVTILFNSVENPFGLFLCYVGCIGCQPSLGQCCVPEMR